MILSACSEPPSGRAGIRPHGFRVTGPEPCLDIARVTAAGSMLLLYNTLRGLGSSAKAPGPLCLSAARRSPVTIIDHAQGKNPEISLRFVQFMAKRAHSILVLHRVLYEGNHSRGLVPVRQAPRLPVPLYTVHSRVPGHAASRIL